MLRSGWWKRIPLLLVLSMALLLTGCPGKGEKSMFSPSVRIGVSLADMERDGNKTIKKIMDERRKKDKVNITWLDAGNDPDKQEKQLEQLLKRKVKVVILQLVDPAMGPDIVSRLKRQGVKVVALETLPANTPLDGYVASDHSRVGELQAQYVLQQAAGKGGRVLVLQGDPDDLAAREITAANEIVLKGNPLVNELRVQSHPQAQPKQARSTVQEFLTGGAPFAILANDSRLAMAAVQVLKAQNLTEQVVTVGVGADKKASEAVASGDHDAEVDNSPELLAQYAMDAAVGLAQTGHWQYDRQVRNGPYDVPAKITPVRLITQKDLYLLTERWGKLEGKGQQEQQASQKKQSDSTGGSKEQGGSSSSGGSSGGGGGSDKQQGKKGKTTLKITTQEGKTMEVEIDGEVKSIQTESEGKKEQQGGAQGQQGQGGQGGGQGGQGGQK